MPTVDDQLRNIYRFFKTDVMLIILSPAKTMDMGKVDITVPESESLFLKEADFLATKMQYYSVQELEKLLKISEKLAEENHIRFEVFDSPHNPEKQVILAYNGSVFKEMKACAFSESDFQYAQEHLRIISTMYGLVRPLDKIKAYRVAYSLKLRGMEGNLYDYWFPRLTEPLIQDVDKAGGILINLASLDVLGALNMDEIHKRVRIVTPEFQEFRNGKYQTIRSYAKQARGAMARHILLNRIESPEKLRTFEWNGFRWNSKISDDEKYIFTR